MKQQSQGEDIRARVERTVHRGVTRQQAAAVFHHRHARRDMTGARAEMNERLAFARFVTRK